MGKKNILVKLVTLLVLADVFSQPAYAQGCALCHTQAASETSRFIAALKDGISILIFPSFVICMALASMAYRRREKFHDADSEQDVW